MRHIRISTLSWCERAPSDRNHALSRRGALMPPDILSDRRAPSDACGSHRCATVQVKCMLRLPCREPANLGQCLGLAVVGSVREAIQAGTIPKATPMTTEIPSGKSSTGTEGVGFTGTRVSAPVIAGEG